MNISPDLVYDVMKGLSTRVTSKVSQRLQSARNVVEAKEYIHNMALQRHSYSARVTRHNSTKA